MADGDNFVLGKPQAATTTTQLFRSGAPSQTAFHVANVLGDGIFGGAAGIGVLGTSTGSSGVFGSSVRDVGVRGVSDNAGVAGRGGRFGVRGDGGISGTGVFGSSARGTGVYGVSGSGYAGAFWGHMFVAGDFFVGGAKSAAVSMPDGSCRQLYSLESPESWFEDFGRARIVRGKARVQLDPRFAAVIDARRLHVFLTPEGDSRGLYVARTSRTGFEVRECQRGSSTLTFSYRVVGRRKDVRGERFARITLPKQVDPPADDSRALVRRADAARRQMKAGRRRVR